jgi:hypothetical protein
MKDLALLPRCVPFKVHKKISQEEKAKRRKRRREWYDNWWKKYNQYRDIGQEITGKKSS